MIHKKNNSHTHNFLKLFFLLFALIAFTSCKDIENMSIFKQDTQAESAKTNVAILLPISGENAEYYKELNKMIKIGLSDGARGKISVTSYDSSNKKLLSESIDKIISNDTDIIIGPIFSEATEVVSAKLRGKKTTIVTLSNNPVLADNNVLVFGHAPMRQIEYLVDQLLNTDYNNYIALLPAGRYSQSVSSVLREMLKSRDATMIRVEYYSDQEEDIARAVKIISDNVDNLNEADYNLTQPVILLGDDPQTLQRVFSYAAQYRLDKKALIAGDGRININTPDKMNTLFTGSIHPNMDVVRHKATKLKITHVGFLHELAYDAGLFVAENISDGYNKSKFMNRAKSISFHGLSGKLHFVDSISQRKYELIKKENNIYTLFTPPNVKLTTEDDEKENHLSKADQNFPKNAENASTTINLQ